MHVWPDVIKSLTGVVESNVPKNMDIYGRLPGCQPDEVRFAGVYSAPGSGMEVPQPGAVMRSGPCAPIHPNGFIKSWGPGSSAPEFGRAPWRF
jgi:hypothetical protein